MSNKETLAEHNERLSAIKAKVEEFFRSGDDGGGAILTVSFGRESESDEGEEEVYLRTDSGAYTVDGGEAVYFEDEAALTITGLSNGSVVEIMPSWADGDSAWCNAKNEVGCTSTLGGETVEGLFSYGGETVKITIGADVASIIVYEIYY